MKITSNFSLSEFTYSEKAILNHIENIPNRAELEWIKFGCINILQPLRDLVKLPVVITSGYRCKRLNAIVGGVTNSQHIIGQAADIRCNNYQHAMTMFNILKSMTFADQVLFEHQGNTKWLHVSWSAQPRHYFKDNYVIR